MVVITPLVDHPSGDNQRLKSISDQIADVYKDIKNKHSNIQVLLDSLNAKDNKYSEHARNI